MSIKIVLTGDNHLNAYFGKMRPMQLEERRKRLKDNFKKTIEFSIKNKVDLYLNLGDLFDMSNPRNDALLAVSEGLSKLCGASIKAFLIGGTHDTPKGSGIIPQMIFAKDENIHVFHRHDTIENLTFNINGIDITIGGITTNPFFGRDVNPLLLTMPFDLKTKSKINILMFHYGIEGYLHPKANEPIIPLAYFNSSPFNYIFSGHVHSANDLYFNEKLFVMPGATEKLTFSEEKQTGFYYLEIDGEKPPFIEFIPIDSQKRRELVIDFNNADNIEDPNSYIINQLTELSHPDQMLKLKIAGSVSRETYQKIKFHNIWQMGQEANFYFEMSRDEFNIIDDKRENMKIGRGRLSQKGEVKRVAEDMINNAGSSEEKEIIDGAARLICKRFEEMKEW